MTKMSLNQQDIESAAAAISKFHPQHLHSENIGNEEAQIYYQYPNAALYICIYFTHHLWALNF